MADRTDDFNRTSPAAIGSPSDGLGNYTEVNPSLGVLLNQLYDVGGDGECYSVLDHDSANVGLQITCVTSASSTWGIVLRYTDSSNFLLAFIRGDDQNVAIYKRDAGTFTLLSNGGNPTSTSVSSGDVWKFEATSAGDLTIYKNAASVVTVNNNFNPSAIKHGLRTNGNATFRWDDLSITAVGGGPATYTAAGSLAVTAATLAGSATFTPLASTASGSLQVSAATMSGAAEFDSPVYTASGSLQATPATASGAAAVTNPTYTASGSLAVSPATAAGTALFAAIVRQATGSLSATPSTLAGSATFSAPTRTASGSLAVTPATASGAASFVAPTRTAAGSLTASNAILSGSASFVSGARTASGLLTTANATLSGAATHVRPTYTASGSLNVSPATMAGQSGDGFDPRYRVVGPKWRIPRPVASTWRRARVIAGVWSIGRR